MPEFVVTQPMVDYIKYEKKKARERMAHTLLALFVFVVGMGGICYLAGYFNG